MNPQVMILRLQGEQRRPRQFRGMPPEKVAARHARRRTGGNDLPLHGALPPQAMANDRQDHAEPQRIDIEPGKVADRAERPVAHQHAERHGRYGCQPQSQETGMKRRQAVHPGARAPSHPIAPRPVPSQPSHRNIALVSHVPLWAWLLLAYPVRQGLRALSDRTVPLRRVVLMPVIFIAWGASGLLARSGTSPAPYLAWLATAASLMPAGYRIGPLHMTIDRVRGLVRRAGTPWPLVRNSQSVRRAIHHRHGNGDASGATARTGPAARRALRRDGRLFPGLGPGLPPSVERRKPHHRLKAPREPGPLTGGGYRAGPPPRYRPRPPAPTQPSGRSSPPCAR